jgi:hypothetical protein
VQRDIRPNAIDWVFCWRTRTGFEVSPDAGLRTIARGRVRTCPRPPIGPRLDQQGMFSRMCAFRWGHVTCASIVPARSRRELEVLREAVLGAVTSGEAREREWALAAIRARGRGRWGLHVGARAAVVADLARRVDAPWTLAVLQNRIDVVDLEGRVLETLEADTVFDDAPVPAFASAWRGAESDAPGGRGGAVQIPYARPTGRGAWGKWV